MRVPEGELVPEHLGLLNLTRNLCRFNHSQPHPHPVCVRGSHRRGRVQRFSRRRGHHLLKRGRLWLLEHDLLLQPLLLLLRLRLLLGVDRW